MHRFHRDSRNLPPPSKDRSAVTEDLNRSESVFATLVRVEGLEPPRPCGHQILSLARLPIPPHPPAREISCRRGTAAVRARPHHSARWPPGKWRRSPSLRYWRGPLSGSGAGGGASWQGPLPTAPACCQADARDYHARAAVGGCGGIGRRARLKIWFPQGSGGSSPSTRTIRLRSAPARLISRRRASEADATPKSDRTKAGRSNRSLFRVPSFSPPFTAPRRSAAPAT